MNQATVAQGSLVLTGKTAHSHHDLHHVFNVVAKYMINKLTYV